MKLLKDNLLDYERSRGVDAKDIAEIAGLPVFAIEQMEQGDYSLVDFSLFCGRLGLDLSSMLDDDGWKEVSIIDQYGAYPQELKRIITRAFYQSVCDIATKKYPNWTPPFHYTLDGRLKAGSACLLTENIKGLQRYVRDYISEEKFYDMLASTMYAKIPNYNYNLAKDAFGVTYTEIGKALGVSPSTASNWGGKWCIAIPDDRIDQFIKVAGGLNRTQFMTMPMSPKDFKQYTCSIPKDRRKRKKKESVQQQIDFPDSPALTNNEEKVYVVKEADNKNIVPAERGSSISLDDEKALKLYKVLDDAQRQKVNNLISELFFG